MTNINHVLKHLPVIDLREVYSVVPQRDGFGPSETANQNPTVFIYSPG
jgi:hypothetical protein